MSKEKGPRELGRDGGVGVTGPIWMRSLLLQCLRREPSAGEIVPQIKSEARLQWRGLTKQCETEATLVEDNPAAWNELGQPASCAKLRERQTSCIRIKSQVYNNNKNTISSNEAICQS